MFSCGKKAPVPVEAPAVQQQLDEHAADLRERFEALPKVQAPRIAPKRVTKPQTKVVKRKPAPPPKKIEDRLPQPQQGPICIFPFGMIPQCSPEPAGRMP